MELRPEHLKHLEALGDTLVLAGPFLADNGDMVGSIVVIEAETLDAARAIFARDPFMIGNLFDSITIKPWKLGVNKTKSGVRIKAPQMAYWLMKSEPDVFSYTDLENKPVEQWHGVRNYTARNNMKAMKIGDLAFFYHSNIGKEIVGIMKVVALAHPDSTAEPNDKGKVIWECVDVVHHTKLPKPVTLETIKKTPELAEHGAGEAFPAVGRAGVGRRMEADLPDGRAQEGALTHVNHRRIVRR